MDSVQVVCWSVRHTRTEQDEILAALQRALADLHALQTLVLYASSALSSPTQQHQATQLRETLLAHLQRLQLRHVFSQSLAPHLPLNTHSVSERKQRAPRSSTRRLSVSIAHRTPPLSPLRNSRSPPSKLPSPSVSSRSFRMSTSHLSPTPTLADQRRRAAQRPRAHLQRLQTRQRRQVHLRQLREVAALQLQHAQLRHWFVSSPLSYGPAPTPPLARSTSRPASASSARCSLRLARTARSHCSPPARRRARSSTRPA